MSSSIILLTLSLGGPSYMVDICLVETFKLQVLLPKSDQEYILLGLSKQQGFTEVKCASRGTEWSTWAFRTLKAPSGAFVPDPTQKFCPSIQFLRTRMVRLGQYL